jgi:MFS family permease
MGKLLHFSFLTLKKASITAGRLLSTVLSTVFDTRIILFFGLAFSAVGLSIMMVYANLITVWIGSVVLGVAMAPLYPAIIAFPQTLGVQTSSSMTAFIISMGGLGSMLIPLGVTSLFEVLGPESLFYLVLLCIVGSSVAFVIMLVAFRTKRNPNEKRSWYSFLFKKSHIAKD